MDKKSQGFALSNCVLCGDIARIYTYHINGISYSPNVAKIICDCGHSTPEFEEVMEDSAICKAAVYWQDNNKEDSDMVKQTNRQKRNAEKGKVYRRKPAPYHPFGKQLRDIDGAVNKAGALFVKCRSKKCGVLFNPHIQAVQDRIKSIVDVKGHSYFYCEDCRPSIQPISKENIFDMSDKKMCSRCNEVKTLDEFYRDKTSKGGRAAMCKDCKKERVVQIAAAKASKSAKKRKVCTKCGKNQLVSDYWNNINTKDGKHTACRFCMAKPKKGDKKQKPIKLIKTPNIVTKPEKINTDFVVKAVTHEVKMNIKNSIAQMYRQYKLLNSLEELPKEDIKLWLAISAHPSVKIL